MNLLMVALVGFLGCGTQADAPSSTDGAPAVPDDEFRRPPAAWLYAPTVPRSPQRPRHKPPGLCPILDGELDPTISCSQELHTRQEAVAAGASCGTLLPVWLCFSEWHSKRLVQMRLTTVGELTKAMPHLEALRTRQNAWLSDEALRRATRDWVGAGNEADQLGIDVHLQAAFALTISRLPKEDLDPALVDQWGASAAHVAKVMDSPMGAQVKEYRPDLHIEIERMLKIATEGAPPKVAGAVAAARMPRIPR